MKRMTLLQLTLNNFMGVKNFVLDLQGQNGKAFGDNGTGKTTLISGFLWLLFNKDSQGKSDFEIKTLDANNNPIHNLDHEVEGIFDIDGRRITLKKSYREKWTKKRGSAISDFTGHTTDYFIDGVPSKKKEFDQVIEGIVNEDVFKLLTSPTYFNEQIKWQERRKILLEVCGDITDSDVIASDKSLSKLPSILNGRSIEDHRKVIVAKRKDINQKIETIQPRIDEVNLMMPDLTGLNEKTLNDQIAGLRIQVEAKEGELSRIQNGGEISAKEKQLREIEGELLSIKNQLNADTFEKVSKKRQEQSQVQQHIDIFQYDIRAWERQIKQNLESIKAKEERMQSLRDEWSEINTKQFDFGEHRTTCYACGQDLPLEQIEEARSNAEAHFNQERAQKLERINSQGKSEKAAVEELKSRNEDLENNVFTSKQTLEIEQSKLKAIKKEIMDLQTSVVNPESDLTYQTKLQEAETVKQEILTLKTSVSESITKVRGEISTLKTEIARLEQDLAKFAQAESFKNRISELEQQEKNLAAEFERLEEQLFLCEEFVKAKVNLLTDRINSKFKYARFKLFKTNINGGIEECCMTTINGIPYEGGLNNAARINAGLDIINTLSEHYGLSATIFVDNSEAVTKLIDVNSQVISLVVSEKDKQLRVETEPNELKEAI